MKYVCFLFLLLISLVTGCGSRPTASEPQISDSAISQSSGDRVSALQTSVSPDVDSILRDYDISGPITLIEKRYAENEAQYAFIIHSTRTEQHKRLAQLFEFNEMEEKEYESIYDSQKKDSLETVAPPRELMGKWLPVFWYKEKPYVVRPCETYNLYIVTDSTFVRWYMDGISPEQITAVEKGNNQITFETGGKRKYNLALADARNSIYHLSGDEEAYVVPLAKASELPIIIEHCTVDGGIFVSYEFKPPGAR